MILSIVLLVGGEEKEAAVVVAQPKPPTPTPAPTPLPTPVPPTPTPPPETPKPTDPPIVSTKGKFSIQSDPGGAEVFIDNVSKGMTPIKKLEVEKGVHSIKIVKEGYNAYETKITIEKDSNFIVNLAKGEIKIKPEEPKAPKITTTRLIVRVPSNSVIIVDGRQYREKTLTLNSLSEGSHMVYVQLKGKKPYTERFSLKKGKPKVINLR